MNDLITSQLKSNSSSDLFKFKNVFGNNIDNELASTLEGFVSSNANDNNKFKNINNNLNPYDNISSTTSIADLDSAFNNVSNFPLFDTATLTNECDNNTNINNKNNSMNMVNNPSINSNHNSNHNNNNNNNNNIMGNTMIKDVFGENNALSLGSSSSETVYLSSRHMSIESHDSVQDSNKKTNNNNYISHTDSFNNVNDNSLIGSFLNQSNTNNIVNDINSIQTTNMKQSTSFEGDASDSSSIFSPSSAMSRAASVSVVEGNLMTHQTGNHLSGHINCNSNVNLRKGSMYEISKMKDEKSKRIRKVKASHNDIEKKYRLSINDKIVQLRNLVPTIRYGFKEISNIPIDTIDIISLDGLEPTKKLNKGTILNKTIEYIKHLENKCNNYKSINEKLLQNIANGMTQMDTGSVKVKLEENEMDNKLNNDLSPLTDSINNIPKYSDVGNSFKFQNI